MPSNAQHSRRRFLGQTAAVAVTMLPGLASAQDASPGERLFTPLPGDWRHFELTTRVDLSALQGPTSVWLPVPYVNGEFQRTGQSTFDSNGKVALREDARQGIRFVHAEFAEGTADPYVEVVSRVQTQNRAVDWSRKVAQAEDPAVLQAYTRPTQLLPTDGIVRSTALAATRGAKTDVEKVRMLFDWVVSNTHREPKVRGCGEGDIKTMLETGNLSGKCADLNALFVGMSRAVGVPARDVYGIRVAPSAFGYRELGGNPASLKGAQHCRAEAYLRGYGWVAMDPADVTKVMRQETPEWIKSSQHPLIAPVNRALFGGWEGNWMAFNTAHDVALPGARNPKDTLGFFMYPTAENDQGRLDSYAPDTFKYQITAKEIAV